MFLPPNFTASNNINTNALVTSSGVNVIKSNFDSFISSIGNLFFSQFVSSGSIALDSKSLVNTVDCSAGNVSITLPPLSTAINSLKTYTFKKIDSSNFILTIAPSGTEKIESFTNHLTTPNSVSLILKLIDQEVTLLPTNSGWRIINHIYPQSLLSCSVGLISSQGMSQGTITTVQFDNKTGQLFDNRNLYDTSGFYYSCYVSGYYLVTGILSIASSAAASHQWAKLYKDSGSGYQDIATLAEFDIGAGLTRYNFSYYLKMTENDKLQLRTANDNTSKTILGGNNTIFSIQFISF